MTKGFDWIYQVVAIILGLFGLWLLYWSLFKDRSRGRRRCPKCWYDMSGNPGSLKCSECGHLTKRERKFFKTRRRWRWTLVALLALGMAAGNTLFGISKNGVYSVIPTSLLIAAYVQMDNKPKSLWQQHVCEELIDRRIGPRRKDGSIPDPLWDWQWRLLVQALTSPSPKIKPKEWTSETIRDKIASSALNCGAVHRVGMVQEYSEAFPPPLEVTLPESWPTDQPMPVSITNGRFSPPGGPASLFTYEVCFRYKGKLLPSRPHNEEALLNVSDFQTPNAQTFEVDLPELFGDEEIEAELTVTYHGVQSNQRWPYGCMRITRTVNFLDRVDELRRRARNRSAPLDRAMSEGSAIRLLPDGQGIELGFDGDAAHRLDGTGNLFRLQILHGSRVIYDRAGLVQLLRRLRDDGVCAALVCPLDETSDPMLTGNLSDDGNWSARWFIDPAAILRSHRGAGHDLFWPGICVARMNWSDLRAGKPQRGELVNKLD